MKKNQYDLIIIGAGAAGSLAAKLASEKNLSVLVLDAGPGLKDKPVIQDKNFSYQTSSYVFNDDTKRFIADDSELHFCSQKEEFHWSHAHCLGGRAMLWQGVTLRMTDRQFKASDKDHWDMSWPIGERELNPYYDRVEHFLKITSYLDEKKKEILKSLKEKLSLEMISCPYTPYYFNGNSHTYRGLVKDSHAYDLLDTANKNLKIQSNAVVKSLLFNPIKKKVEAVIYFDKNSAQDKEVSAKKIILCASTLESTRILMASKLVSTSKAPLAESCLGQNLMTHLKGVSLSAGFAKTQYIRHPQELIHSPFQNSFSDTDQFLRGWGLQIRVKESMSDIKINAFGEDLAYQTNQVSLDSSQLDKWGRALLNISYHYGDNEERMRVAQVKQMQAVVQKLNIKNFKIKETLQAPGKNNHELGTVRMGDKPSNSVLNSYNQVWGYDNLYVTDGSAFTSSGYQNPTLTILALTWRACNHLIENLKMES